MNKLKIYLFQFLIIFNLIIISSTNVFAANIPKDALVYKGNSYYVYNDVSTWEEAQEKCLERGGHLATVANAEEDKALFDYITSLGYEDAYIGLTDKEQEGEWKWINGENSTYRNWAGGEPNNQGNENYAMYYYKNKDGSWNDGNFKHGTDKDPGNYLCEWEVTSSYQPFPKSNWTWTYKGQTFKLFKHPGKALPYEEAAYQQGSIDHGGFDWSKAIISAFTANNNSLPANSDSGAIGGSIKMIKSSIEGGLSGIQNIQVILNQPEGGSGDDGFMYLVYGEPFEKEYAGGCYFLSELYGQDMDKYIRQSFEGLEGDGTYDIKIKFASQKSLEECPYGYTVLLDDFSGHRAYQYPIIHEGTTIQLYWKPDGVFKKRYFVADITSKIRDRRLEMSKDVADRIFEFFDTYEPKPVKNDNKVSFSLKKWISKCPVDVEVYDETGTKIKTIKDKQLLDEETPEGRFTCYYNPDTNEYEKSVYVPNDKNYSIKLIGNDEGEVHLTKIDSEALYKNTIPVNNSTILTANQENNSIEIDKNNDGIIDSNMDLEILDVPEYDLGYISVHRLYHNDNYEHLYTTDENEVKELVRAGWKDEDIGWTSADTGDPVYRLYSPITNEHLYTSDQNEVSTLSQNGWSIDNNNEPMFYSSGEVPVYRLYHEGVQRHHLTTDENEYNALGQQGWNKENIALHAAK